MSNAARPLALVCSLAIAALGAPALGAPSSLRSIDVAPGVILTGFEVDLDGSMAIAGTAIDTSTMFTPFRARAFFGGLERLSDVSGELGQEPSMQQTGGATEFGASVWIARGDQVMKRTSSGWAPASAPALMAALHAVDAQRIVAVGEGGSAGVSTDGGASWIAVSTGTDVDLRGMFWRDDRRGWAWGYTIETEGGGFDGGEEQRFVRGAAVIATTDGGDSWSPVTARTAMAVGPVFFLDDGVTGWMAGAVLEPEGTGARAELFATTDGGRSWASVALPEQVGTVDAGFSTEPVGPSLIQSMWWDDANNGRMFLTAHLFDATAGESGGGGSQTTRDASGWMIMEFVTGDGGKTWQYEDLGTIELEFSFEGVQAEHDGGVSQGTALSWSRHAMLGDGGNVWVTTDWGSDPERNGGGGGGGGGGAGGGGTDGGGDGTGGGARPGRQPPTGVVGAADEGCGCAAAAGSPWPPLALGALALTALQRRRYTR